MKASTNQGWMPAVAIVAATHLSACGASIVPLSRNYDVSSAEAASAGISTAASAADSAGSVIASNGFQDSRRGVEKLLNLLVEPKAEASTCSSSAAVRGATCTGTVMNISLSGCAGLVGTWNGNLTLTYSSSSACTAASTSGLMNMGAGNSVTITTTNASLSVGSFTVSMTSAPSGFSTPQSGGIKVTCGSSGCDTSRTVNILGINRILNSNAGPIYNHTLNTPTAFTIQGTGMSRQITAGQLQLQQNSSHFVANSTITKTLTFSNACCAPTGGSLATNFSTGKTGSEALVFSGDCGYAAVNSNMITLPYCM